MIGNVKNKSDHIIFLSRENYIKHFGARFHVMRKSRLQQDFVHCTVSNM